MIRVASTRLAALFLLRFSPISRWNNPIVSETKTKTTIYLAAFFVSIGIVA